MHEHPLMPLTARPDPVERILDVRVPGSAPVAWHVVVEAGRRCREWDWLVAQQRVGTT
jgi:hypothetical protein